MRMERKEKKRKRDKDKTGGREGGKREKRVGTVWGCSSPGTVLVQHT